MNFHKYHGTGNDFILIDNRDGVVQLTGTQIAHLCHRHFGIGADGLMLLEQAKGYDFRMVYYNSDGGESTMCGNGGRCIVAFAHSLGIIADTATFIATDGPHQATIFPDGIVSLHMKDVTGMDIRDGYTVLNTGSPHYVKWIENVNAVDVVNEGRNIRNQPEYMPDGINVNFTANIAGTLMVRTYERGVEDETLSCGTGVTAAAIASYCHGAGHHNTMVMTNGGILTVSFTKDSPQTAVNVVLSGMTRFVYSGIIEVEDW